MYRNDWRSKEDILFELDLLCHLERHQCSIVAPIKSINGINMISLDAAEGRRYGVLFPYADGRAPGNELNAEHATLLGFEIAKIHQEGHEFHTRYQRQRLDLEYLLEQSINNIKEYLCRNDRLYIASLANNIRSNIPDLPSVQPYYTICTGDVNPTNFFINKEKRIRIFDFDQCGFGWRSFEIAKFSTSISKHKSWQILLSAFIAGYEKLSVLDEVELRAIPYFTLISHLWVAAIHVYNKQLIGDKYLELAFWQRRIDLIKKIENELALFE